MLAGSRLSEEARARLADALGADGVVVDDLTRARHAGGQSYADLVRRRRGDASEAPDAVLYPASADAVADVLRICSLAHIAVVPWGGGTSVVGGLSALRGDCVAVVALDLGRLDRLLDVDLESLTATFEPGIRTPAAEAALAAQGLTLGHVPQSYERASLGGYVVTRSAGQASSGIGRIDDLLVGCRLQTPRGEITLPALPASAAGPDLRRLVLGSEGTLGVVTELTLRVRPLPEATRYEAWTARTWEAGLRIIRGLAQVGPKPDVLRLSDPDETQVSLALSGTAGAKRRDRRLDADARRARELPDHRRLPGHLPRRASSPPRGTSRASYRACRPTGPWWRRVVGAPPIRRALSARHPAGCRRARRDAGDRRDLDEAPKVYAGVTRALSDSLQYDGRPPLVGCHVSHVYPTGASLYFTALARADQGREIEQWSAAKHAANEAIVAAGGTASHHHAVGTAHRDIVVTDLGGTDGVGVEALRAMKSYLDPAGILNPGKLLPDRAG